MKFLKFIVPLVLVFQIAVFAQKFAANSSASVENSEAENCKQVGKNPVVTVCVEMTGERARYSKRLGKAVKRAVRQLIKESKGEEEFSPIVTPRNYGASCTSCGDWDAECTELTGAADYCELVENVPGTDCPCP